MLFRYYTISWINKKKRDCTIAVPHFEALVLPLHLTSNTEAHADMYEHATYLVACTWIYISRGHQNAAMPWCFIRIYQIPKCQVKALYDALYINMFVSIPTLNDIISSFPTRGLIYATTLYFFFYFHNIF